MQSHYPSSFSPIDKSSFVDSMATTKRPPSRCDDQLPLHSRDPFRVSAARPCSRRPPVEEYPASDFEDDCDEDLSPRRPARFDAAVHGRPRAMGRSSDRRARERQAALALKLEFESRRANRRRHTERDSHLRRDRRL